LASVTEIAHPETQKVEEELEKKTQNPQKRQSKSIKQNEKRKANKMPL
jgi:hypothetical protein